MEMQLSRLHYKRGSMQAHTGYEVLHRSPEENTYWHANRENPNISDKGMEYIQSGADNGGGIIREIVNGIVRYNPRTRATHGKANNPTGRPSILCSNEVLQYDVKPKGALILTQCRGQRELNPRPTLQPGIKNPVKEAYNAHFAEFNQGFSITPGKH